MAMINIFQVGASFLTYEREFVLGLVMLENSVLPMGWDSLHTALKVMLEL